LLLLAPGRVLSMVARSPLDSASLRVARVLGGRHLAQAALIGIHPTAARRLAGALVDAAHAGSMVALAHWGDKPVHRRLARASATTASIFAVAEGAAAAGGLRADTAGID
jgi:hypothetical protein